MTAQFIPSDRKAVNAVRRLALLALAVLTGACSTLGYYTHLASGEMAVLNARRPITQVIADPHTDPRLRARLQTALKARAFASDVLKLPRNRSYTLYADIHRPFVMVDVFATPSLSLQAVEHCFPISGCVAYQGFYDMQRAQAAADKLKRAGDDVYLDGVPAYSTLGHFADPLLSTMDGWSEDDLVGTIFHELAHQQFYVEDDTAFNESFATFVQQEGLRQWRAANGLPPSDPAADRRDDQFTELVLATRGRLEKLYASDLPDAVKLQRKQQEFDRLRADYRRLRDTEWHGNRDYDAWIDAPINNAKLLPFGLYDKGVPAFAALFKQCGGDWTKFYAAVRRIGGETAKQRAVFLAGAKDIGPQR
ncbi:MAG TPA: aminopeptidase [Rhodanobacteraceae bacterium]|nr:aminopeptidase [Rhodanobacteraceae bacterium]